MTSEHDLSLSFSCDSLIPSTQMYRVPGNNEVALHISVTYCQKINQTSHTFLLGAQERDIIGQDYNHAAP